LDESISQLKKALETASRLAVNTKQRDAHLYLSKCYEKQEKWKEAYIHLDAFKKINLNIFSNQQIEISRLKNRELEKQRMQIQEMHEELKDSIVYSKRIQTALLPPDESIVNMGYDSFVLYLPKDIVAGDFYWMEKIGEDLLIAVADCTGHGVPGAMVSVVCHNALNRAVREFELREPGAILDKVNQLVQQTFAQSSEKVKDGMDISFLRLNQHQKIYQWAGANNPLYILREGIEEMEVIKGDKQPIGHYDHTEQFQNHQLNVMTGDQLYLFTDGFADQFGGPKLKKYKYSPFKRMLSSLRSLKTEEQKVAIEGEFNSWKGNQEQVDDVCIWGVKI
jgi:serine phosphatase RsbU (regulator of sigma subunit)